MDLEIRHLRLVAAVADEGSLTRAGEQLHLTQSALSHQLLDIEQRLGTLLFHRVNKRMVLTQAGERVLATARRVLTEMGQTEEDVRSFAADRRGAIRLTTECYTCYHWLPALMKTFHRKHAGIELHIDVESTTHPADALLAGTLDLAIMSTPVHDARLRSEALFDDELLVVTAPDHPLASRPYVRPKELAAQTLLTYHDVAQNSAYLRVLRPAGLEPSRTMRVPLTEAMIEMIRAGIGVAALARWAIAPWIEAGVVATVPLTSRGLKRTWSAVTLRTPRVPAYLADFVTLLAKETPKIPVARRKLERAG